MSETFTILDSQGETLYEGEGDSLGAVVAASVALDTDLSDAQLIGADLSGLDLTGAILVGANLIGAVITNTNLTDADLTDAVMDGADISNCTVAGTKLSAASLVGVNRSGVNLLSTDMVYPNDEVKQLKYTNSTIPAGNTLSNTDGDFFETTYAVPAGSLKPKDMLRVTARGVYSTVGVAPTIEIRVHFEVSGGPNLVLASIGSEMTVNAGSDSWFVQADMVVMSATSVIAGGFGVLGYGSNAGAYTRCYTDAEEQSGFDSAVAGIVGVHVGFSTADVGNTITMQQLVVESLKG